MSTFETQPNQTENTQLSLYYLWLKSLTKEELKTEYQDKLKQATEPLSEEQLHLLAIYSLPSSHVFSPYRAKSMLNNQPFNAYIESTQTPENRAFVSILRDQLNQQLLLMQRADNLNKKAKQTNAQLTLQLTMAQQASAALEKKLNQLKSIEQQLSK
ncbi:hypothetical protein ACFSJY_02215 [Thalassotalea euphylliae]|uniref:hypothetical protein n=1 Tax=Thalassotalea euphylliae TaxID=1655234 RepID=UPI00362AA0FC